MLMVASLWIADNLLILSLFLLGLATAILVWRYRRLPLDEVQLQFQSNPANDPLVVAAKLPGRKVCTPIWGYNGHLQTLYSSVVRTAPKVAFERQMITLWDGAELRVDWAAPPDATPSTPIVVVVPGISGHSQQAYLKAFVSICLAEGWRCLAKNHRGCGENHPLTTPRLFSSGEPRDLNAVVAHAVARFPEAPVVLVGFSMGANVVVNYLGADNPHTRHVIAGVSVGQGYDVIKGMEHLVQKQPLYEKVLTYKLKAVVRKHQQVFEQHESVDVSAVLQSNSISEFDRHLTIPTQVGMPLNMREFYRQLSSLHRLPLVDVPLLLVNSLDDPIVDRAVIPWDCWKFNSNLILAVLPHGGHLGFAQGSLFPSSFNASDEMLRDWVAACFAAYAARGGADGATPLRAAAVGDSL